MRTIGWTRDPTRDFNSYASTLIFLMNENVPHRGGGGGYRIFLGRGGHDIRTYVFS